MLHYLGRGWFERRGGGKGGEGKGGMRAREKREGGEGKRMMGEGKGTIDY